MVMLMNGFGQEIDKCLPYRFDNLGGPTVGTLQSYIRRYLDLIPGGTNLRYDFTN